MGVHGGIFFLSKSEKTLASASIDAYGIFISLLK
jgi:hypothetical protein